MIKRFGYEVMIILAIFAVFYGIQAMDVREVPGMPMDETMSTMLPNQGMTTTVDIPSRQTASANRPTRSELPELEQKTQVVNPDSAPEGLVLGGIDFNCAEASALSSLKGIGPVLAQRIVDHREARGPFSTSEDLLEVKGIGPKLLEKIRKGERDKPEESGK